MSELAPRQREVLLAIKTFYNVHGYMPSIRQIGKLVNIGSTNGVMDHLKALQNKGYLTWEKGLARTIKLLEAKQ